MTLLATCALLMAQATATPKVTVAEGKTWLIDTNADIERVSIASPEVAEAIPATMRTVMINGKKAGETSAVLWLSDGTRQIYDVGVTYGNAALAEAKTQIAREFGDEVHLTGDTSGVYLTGSVKDLYASVRAESIAASVGKVVDLLKIDSPPQEPQILLKVKFADVDRSKANSLGGNLIGAPGKWPFNLTTGANAPSRFTAANASTPSFTLADALNILMFDPHANIGATIQAMQSQSLLQVLAEPNLLAMNGKEASFTAGGEFPFPTLQGGGSGVGQVTIQFREFGIRLKFTPTITPRGTIRLHVAPEVSSLDFANSLTVQGSVVPGMNTRKVETDVELADGQSFAISGLLDQRTTESLSKIPGFSSIPYIGKLFQSKSVQKSNSELLVIVTPELVAPISAGEALPDLVRPTPFLTGEGILNTPPQTPGPDKTGPPPQKPARDEVPVQEILKYEADQRAQKSETTTESSGFGGQAANPGTSGGLGAAGIPQYAIPPQAVPATNQPQQKPQGAQ